MTEGTHRVDAAMSAGGELALAVRAGLHSERGGEEEDTEASEGDHFDGGEVGWTKGGWC